MAGFGFSIEVQVDKAIVAAFGPSIEVQVDKQIKTAFGPSIELKIPVTGGVSALADTLTLTSVATGNIEHGVIDTLTITDLATGQTANNNVIDTLSLADSNTVERIIQVFDALALTQLLVQVQNIIDNIGITDVGQGLNATAQPNSLGGVFSNTSELTGSKSLSAIISTLVESQSNKSLSAVITTQAATNGLQRIVSVNDTIQLVSKAQGGTAINDPLNLTSTASFTITPRQTPSNTVTLIQSVVVIKTQTDIFSKIVGDALTLTDAASATKAGRPVSNALTLTDQVSVQTIFNRSVTSPLWPGQGISNVSDFGPLFFRASGPQTSNVIGDTLTQQGPEVVPLLSSSISDLNPSITDALSLADVASFTVIWLASRVQNLYLTDAVSETVRKWYAEAITHNIALTQIGDGYRPLNESDVLVLTDAVALIWIHHASDTLVLAQAVTSDVSRNTSSALTLSQTVSVSQVLNFSESDVLALSDLLARVWDASGSSALALTDTVAVDASHGVWDTLTLTDSGTEVTEYTRVVVQGLNVIDAVSVFNSHIFDFLTLSDSAILTVQETVSDTISPTDRVDHVFPITIPGDPPIPLVQTVVAEKLTPAQDTITLAEVLGYQQTLNFSVVDNIGITQGVLGYQNTGPDVCGESYGSLGYHDGITLTYPYVSPTLTLNLRDPDFGNTFRIVTNTINRRLRGGALSAGRKASWPTLMSFTMSFQALSEVKKNEFLDFITQSAGYEIGLLDHENRQWRGVLLIPEAVTTQVGPGCLFSTRIEFQGTLV